MSIPEDIWRRLKPRDKIVYWHSENADDPRYVDYFLISLNGKIAATILKNKNTDECHITIHSWIGRIERNINYELIGFDRVKHSIEYLITNHNEFRILTEKEAALL